MVAHDEADEEGDRRLRDDGEWTTAQTGWPSVAVAVEHLDGAHGDTVGFGKAIGMQQRLTLGELAHHLALDGAVSAELLERSIRLGIAALEQPQAIDPLSQVVEQQIVVP